MTDMRKFGGQGLVKLDDVRDKPFRDQIAAVTVNQYERPVLHFKCGRQFSLNVTNTEVMLKAFGEDDSDWIGKFVELYPGMLPWNGGQQEGVCLRATTEPEQYVDGAKGKRPTAHRATSAPDEFGLSRKPTQQTKQKSGSSSPDLNDDIPY
jgi:hypothetical protein